VVDGSAAVGENTALVGAPVRGVDGDGNSMTGQGVVEVVAAWNVHKALDLEFAFIDFAGLVASDVRVVCGGNQSLVTDVLEGRVHPSSIAALVAIGPRAID
jgi:hypothetical protein